MYINSQNQKGVQIASSFAEELERALKAVWDNRLFLSYSDIKNLKRIAGKKI